MPQSNTVYSLTKAFIPIVVLLFTLTSCATMESWFGGGDKVQLPATTLAQKGMEEFQVGNYYKALKYFDEIMTTYPFSEQAMLAELKAADSHFYRKEYEEAKVLYQEYEEQYPTNEARPYIIFQIGMCDYNRIDTVDRDTSGAIQAIEVFSQLIKAHPDSPYTEEARARRRIANEFLVHHEYFVVKYYLRTKKYDQAMTRLQYLIGVYPNSTITPKAKELLQRLEDGNPPKYGISSWFPDFSLPDWGYSSDEDTKEPKRTGERNR